jgi:phosphoglycerol transferase MdoB-like AlkP superfamily enzyme
LESRFGLKGDRWGIEDKEVLARSAQMLRTATIPTCHFVITLTTHTSYTLLTPDEKEIFPDARTTYENYMNNMRYLDNCLRDYITALGRGTTIMIYADHPTEEGFEFTPDRDRSGAREFIPCFIHDTDQDLSKLQKTRKNSIAFDGSLNLVDMINYLRGQVKRSCEPAEAAKAGQ